LDPYGFAGEDLHITPIRQREVAMQVFIATAVTARRVAPGWRDGVRYGMGEGA
jgi:hypothetical protein